MVDFANILFAGPCNRFCPFCIGKEVSAQANKNNLDVYPLLNWENFIATVRRLTIHEIVFTGTTTDPHLYRHEARLIERVRHDLPEARLSIHTNGVLSLKKIDTFNLYDRACISFPSFNQDTYARMMGVRKVPNLKKIYAAAKIPLKVSCVINEHNIHEVNDFLQQLAAINIQRVVLRRLFGDRREWKILSNYTPQRYYRKNPVYRIHGMEVTWWNFSTTTSRSINLFSDGTISENYLLTETPLSVFSLRRAPNS